MADLLDIVEDYSPPEGQTGVPLRSTVDVVFSSIMDEESVEQAFFVEGPDNDTVFGPDSVASVWPSALGEGLGREIDFLESPAYQGVVQGAFSFADDGSQTTMTFTPSKPFGALTSYVAHLTDCYSLSVGDAVAGVGNTGDGEVDFFGTWNGSSDSINIRITAAGVAGVAEFVWWKTSDPFVLGGPLLSTRRDEIPLYEGIYINFGEGTFAEDDEYSADLSSAVLCSGHLIFGFETGSGQIQSLPSSGSTSVLASLRQGTLSSSVPLQVVSIDPENHAGNVDPDLSEIVVTFNKNLDSDTVTSDVVKIVTEAATGHPSAATVAKGLLAKQVEVSGRRLIIKI